MSRTKKYSLIALGVFVVLVVIGNLLPPVPEDKSEDIAKQENKSNIDSTKYETITLGDEELSRMYRTTYDSLYNLLIAQDNADCIENRRSSLHKEIEKFIYEDWWNMMEIVDSTRASIPLCKKEYEFACKQYDKQYERYLKYGDEDKNRIEYWAKEKGRMYLKKVAVDPESLVIEEVRCNGKVSKGWKCVLIYRAKNGFGGYVRESLTMIMSYDNDNELYECVDIV